MIFSELTICGFRSIAPKGLTVRFDPDHNVCALVGANNAGKSNILDALGLVLGIRNGKFYNYRIGPSDFYNGDTSSPITIRLSLTVPLAYRNVYQQRGSIDGFVLTAKEYTKGANKGEIHVDHYCFGRNAKGAVQEPLIEPQRIYKKQSNSDPEVENPALPLLAKDYAYELGPAYFLDIQNLSTFFNVSGTGPLGKVFRLYREDFEKDQSKYKYRDASGEREMPSKDAFVRAAGRIAEILKTKKLLEIEEKLSKNITQYLGLPATQGATLNLGIPDHQELFSEMLTLRVNEVPGMQPVNISSLGSGYLSLFRVATLQTLAELKLTQQSVYLIEEPEIYLHPHLRAFFSDVIRSLAASGNQIAFTTHSEEFVSLKDYAEIARINKSASGFSEVSQVPVGTMLNFDRLHLKLQAKGNSDILFARHVLLTEGQDDRAIFAELLGKRGVNCPAESISIVDCGGKAQIPDYVRLCEALAGC